MDEKLVRQKNLFYYSLVSEYIEALDASRTSSGINKQTLLAKCKKLEAIMRVERDKFKGKVERVPVIQEHPTFL